MLLTGIAVRFALKSFHTRQASALHFLYGMSSKVVSVTPSQILSAYETLAAARLQDCLPMTASGKGYELAEVVAKLNAYGFDLTERRLRDRLAGKSFPFALGLALTDVLSRLHLEGKVAKVPDLKVTFEQAVEAAKAPKIEARAEREAKEKAEAKAAAAKKSAAKPARRVK